MLLDKRVFIYNLTRSTTGEAYTVHPAFPSGLMMNIQPAGPQFTQLAEGQLWKTYKAFTLSSGVVETYKVVASGNVTASGTSDGYIVRGREIFNYGIDTHYELVLEKATR